MEVSSRSLARGGDGSRSMRAAPVLLAAMFVLAAAPAGAVPISVHATDAPGQGFNDPTPVAPVGGNPGTTLGEQRTFLFQYAADLWSERLGGSLVVRVSASFAALGGTATSATLGFASPTTVHRDFANAPEFGTWYVAALANQRSGTDLNDLAPGACPVPLVAASCPEIFTQFNSDVDNQTVLGPVDFYYGIDGNSGSDIGFLSVILHEIGHGLGFLDLIDPFSGELFQGFTDAYTSRLESDSLFANPKELSQMSDLQRMLAIRDDGNIVFRGPAVVEATGGLVAGTKADGAPQIYAPTTYRPGSSVSHLDVDVSPNELMEPFITNPPPQDLTITTAVFSDLGWSTDATDDCGDPNGDGKTSTGDALIVLRGAVGSGECPDSACDVNNSGLVTTADAQLVLKKAVGQDVTLTCPAA